VVLIRLASRTQTLRWFAKNDSPERIPYSRETLDIYSPLANRLGVWQLKWELEDLSFRYLEAEVYCASARCSTSVASSRQHTSPGPSPRLARELGRWACQGGDHAAEAHLLHLEQDALGNRSSPR